tara:strand:+ start:293 stop:670 length:378 start_codon:yes stop_codon:yes gene_type:complete
MNYKFFWIFFLSCIVFSNDLYTFKLEDGTKITGTILSEEENIFEIETELGIIQIQKDDIKKYKCKVFMNNGNVLVGKKVSSSDTELILNTDLGVFKIKKDDYFLCVPSINNTVYISLMFIIAIFK